MADDNDIVNRDDMNSNTNVFYEQQLLAMKLADVFNTDVKKKLKTIAKKKCIFPTTDTIYSKDIVMEQEGNYKYYGNYNSATTKYKKQYDGYYDYYNNRHDNYNDYYGGEEEEENNLVRERSEKLTHKDNYFDSKDRLAVNASKFISKSKSPIVTKKKLSNINNSLSPNQNKKIDIDSEKAKTALKSEVITNNITPFNENKKLYAIREKSRFDFVKNNDNNADVPDHVCDVICKKFSRYSFFNKFDNEFKKNIDECMYFEKELKRDDSWSQFILKNMENK
jgi:hypothetical protein